MLCSAQNRGHPGDSVWKHCCRAAAHSSVAPPVTLGSRGHELRRPSDAAASRTGAPGQWPWCPSRLHIVLTNPVSSNGAAATSGGQRRGERRGAPVP